MSGDTYRFGVALPVPIRVDRLEALQSAASDMLVALEKARDSIVALGTYINVPGLEPAGRALYVEGAAALRAISTATAAAKAAGIKTES